jgi:hypothetical protein
LKEFYLLHPTFIYKTILNFFKPFVSKKFWSKFHPCDKVDDIFQFIEKSQIPLHAEVLLHNYFIVKTIDISATKISGIGLEALRISKNQIIPESYKQLFKFLSQKDYVQGIFKISGRGQEVENLVRLIDHGDEINLNQSDIHAVASSLKYFFKQLDPPLLTYEKYDDFLGVLNQLSKIEI